MREQAPQVFSGPVAEVWPEAWDFNKAVCDACFAGEERVFRDALFVLDRHGAPQEAWLDLYYGPAVDEQARYRA